MAIELQLKNGTLKEWEESNPILAEGEVGVVLEPSGGLVVGNGKDRFKDLPFKPWAQDAYDILVTYGGYRGTKEDFCRELSSSLRMPEQQAGVLTNAGAGWNSFTFPKEFAEDVFVILTPQAAAVFTSVKNITKQGFHYCLYDAAGETVSNNVVVNYMATAVSELNMAQAIAKAAGLNPFAYDNLTSLFADHAAEVVSSEAAFNMVKRSGMAAGRYICHLTGLNPVSYHNIVSLAGDETAMNTIAVTGEALTFVVMSSGAYDGLRLSSMAMGKYLTGLLSVSPERYLTVTNLLDDTDVLTKLIADTVAMRSLCGSEVASKEMAAHPAAASAVAASSTAMSAVAASSTAYNAIYNNSEAYAKLLNVKLAMDTIAGEQDAVTALIDDAGRCEQLASSAVAMDALASSAVARNTIQSNSASWKVVTDSTSFIAKYAIGCLDSGTHKPENFANMAAVVSNSAALAALAASSTAMSALAASSTAMSALAASSVARNVLLNNSSTWNIVIGSDTFIAKYAIGCLNSSSYNPANFAGMSAVVASQGALSALASSSVAMTALASSSVARLALYTNYGVTQSILAGSDTALTVMRNSSSFGEVRGDATNNNWCQLYAGKCFVLTMKQNNNTGNYYHNLRTMVDGSAIQKGITETYNKYVAVGKFASTLESMVTGYGERNAGQFCEIFKI